MQQGCPLCIEQSSDKQFPVVPQHKLNFFTSSISMYHLKDPKASGSSVSPVPQVYVSITLLLPLVGN